MLPPGQGGASEASGGGGGGRARTGAVVRVRSRSFDTQEV